VAPASSGVNIHPEDSATESTQANLTFELVEGSSKTKVNLPIVYDETAPNITDGAYNNSTFTLTASEDLQTKLGVPQILQVVFSKNGDFTDSTTLSNGTDYILEQPVGNKLQIILTGACKTNYPVSSGSKFKFIVSGYFDHANNELNQEKVIEVSQY
jgi:hypothetical protein